MGGIYGWKKKETGEIKYVGKAIDFNKRLKQHQHYDKRGRCSALYDAFDKYGIDAFEFVILQDDITDPVHMQLAEGQWARDLETLEAMGKGGYNLQDPWNEHVMRSPTRSKRISESLCKYNNTPEGKKETKERIARRAENKEWLENVTNAILTTISDPEVRKKHYTNTRKLQIPVVCIETQCLYESATVAAKEMNCNKSHIIAVCRGREQTSGGFHWRYATEEEYPGITERVCELYGDMEDRMQKRGDNPDWHKKLREAQKKLKDSPEYRENRKKVMENRKKSPTWNKNQLKGILRRARPVVCIETNVTYIGLAEASRQTAVPMQGISKVCQGKMESTKGTHWRYATEEETIKIRKEILGD